MYDFSAKRSSATVDSGPFVIGSTSHYSYVGAAYYPSKNMKIDIVSGLSDSDKSDKISLTFQPKSFNNAIAMQLYYLNSNIADQFAISVSYYFDTKVSLLDRTRKY